MTNFIFLPILSSCVLLIIASTFFIFTDAEPPDKPESFMARVTAYAPNDNKSGICSDGDPTTTSTGARPGKDICAVDPDRIPYGMMLDIPGYGMVTAADTGGALRESGATCIDVYFDTYEEAITWGVQWLEVTIVD